MSGITVHDEAHDYDRLDSKGHSNHAGTGLSIIGGVAVLVLIVMLALVP
ncbi:MAG TPA: hypothetical protein VIN59_03045 [Alphaproteobacteria bacterium]